MPSQDTDGKPADLSHVNANAVTAAMFVFAVMLAFVGTMVPDWAGMTGPEATWIPFVFYAMAIADVGVALYLRHFIRKAQRNNAPGGTIQRQ